MCLPTAHRSHPFVTPCCAFVQGLKPPVLVFLQSKDRARELYDELRYEAINVDVIHAGRTKDQRDEAVKRFRTGETWVLITTDLMCRGMDFKGVNLVVNYDFPQVSTLAGAQLRFAGARVVRSRGTSRGCSVSPVSACVCYDGHAVWHQLRASHRAHGSCRAAG